MRAICLLALLLPVIVVAQAPMSTGLLFDDDAYNEVPVKAKNIGFHDPIVGITSMSLKPYVPEIRNQGIFGTCVGWATTYYARTIMQAVAAGVQNQPEITAFAYSPTFTYRNANDPNDKDCSGGAYATRALKALVEKGAPNYSLLPISCVQDIPGDVVEQAKQNTIKDFNRLFVNSDANDIKIAALKRALVNKNPVVIGFEVERSLFHARGVYEPDGLGVNGGHAMCIIGYDDNQYGGAFEVVNSWGKEWGNEGFLWIRYDDFVKYTRYGYEMIPTLTTREKTMSGKLRLELADGGAMETRKGDGKYKKSVLGWQQVVVEDSIQSIGDYQTDRVYPEGTRYRMHVEVGKPAYVYVFGADSENHNGVLFPHQPEISAYIAYQNAEVIIPGERYWFKLNGDIESDYSIVLFSEQKIDAESVKSQLDTLDGNLMDKLYLIFKDKLISRDKIGLSQDGIGFTARYASGSMVMLLVDIKRK